MTVVQIHRVTGGDEAGARLPHDEKYEEGSAFVNGDYCARDDAAVPIRDLGFTQADATYEVATVSRGRFFRLHDHFERFAQSCEKFRLRNPYTDAEMVEIFSKLLRLSGLRNALVFWCVTRGLAKQASDRNNPDAFQNRFYTYATDYSSIATHEQRSKGLDLLISKKYIRIPPEAVDPTVKNLHWQDMKLSLFEARDHGEDWSVLTDGDGYLTECPGANIFVIKAGELYTPDSGCLQGITRQTALELAEMIGVPAHVERVHARQLREADDAFITSSAGGIMPVNRIDGVILGGVDGPGELAIRLHNLYWEKVWQGWKSIPVDYDGSGSPSPSEE